MAMEERDLEEFDIAIVVFARTEAIDYSDAVNIAEKSVKNIISIYKDGNCFLSFRNEVRKVNIADIKYIGTALYDGSITIKITDIGFERLKNEDKKENL